jgi:hypothetical protein
MTIGTRIYQNYSICECGYPALNESVPLGKVYDVDESTVSGGYTFICGGCRKTHVDVNVVFARDPRGGFYPMPLGVFEKARGH